MSVKSIINRLFGQTKKDESWPKSLGDVNANTPTHVKSAPKGVNTSSYVYPEDAVKAEEENAQSNVASEEKKTGGETYTFNLIILDESGSMSGSEIRTVTGCNETLNSIRSSAREHPKMKQMVSIFCFDTSNSRYLFCNKPIEDVEDVKLSDYRPNACTPLYDAIGYTVTHLEKAITGMDSVGLVTIITDGYENASQRWSHRSVVNLIESLKRKGWVFTFIGANIDVKRTALDLGIDSFMEFEQSDEGMREMFEQESRSRRAYYAEREYAMDTLNYACASQELRDELYGAMNTGYFVEEERVAPAVIRRLGKDQVFVFGSNVLGHHDGGAANIALKHFGAVYGQNEGLQGQSYAIPTVGNSFEELKEAVRRFNEFVVRHPELKFMLTAIGCGNAGYKAEEIAPLFSQAYKFGNVYVPTQFMPYVNSKSMNY